VPFWWDLRSVVIMLGVVDPSVTARNFLLGVQIFEILIPELVLSDMLTILGITDIVGISPPLPQARPLDVP